MYVSAQDVILYAEIPSPTAEDEALLDAFILAAQDYIDGYCHQTFEVTDDSTRTFDALCNVEGRRLWFDYPLCAVTTITNGDGAVLTPAEYVTEPRNGTPWYALTLKSSSGTSWTYDDAPEDAITIEGRWGYSLSAPAGIVQITKELVAYYWRQKDSTGDLDRAVLVGNNTVLPAQIPMDIKEKLCMYRRMVLP